MSLSNIWGVVSNGTLTLYHGAGAILHSAIEIVNVSGIVTSLVRGDVRGVITSAVGVIASGSDHASHSTQAAGHALATANSALWTLVDVGYGAVWVYNWVRGNTSGVGALPLPTAPTADGLEALETCIDAALGTHLLASGQAHLIPGVPSANELFDKLSHTGPMAAIEPSTVPPLKEIKILLPAPGSLEMMIAEATVPASTKDDADSVLALKPIPVTFLATPSGVAERPSRYHQRCGSYELIALEADYSRVSSPVQRVSESEQDIFHSTPMVRRLSSPLRPGIRSALIRTASFNRMLLCPPTHQCMERSHRRTHSLPLA